MVLNGATSQLDRLRGAPAPERVRVDGRSVAQLLAFAAEYGTLIQFYDLTDTPDGHWGLFFAADPAVGLALLAGLDLADIEQAFERRLSQLRQAHGLEERLRLAQRAIGVMLRLIRILNRGGGDLPDIDTAFGDVISANRHDALAAPMRRLRFHMDGGTLEHRLRRELDGLARDWFSQFATFLAEVVDGLLHVLQQETTAARAQLQASLQDQDHAPQAALYNAFVMLFGHAQNAMNRFPRRLVEFYYATLLQQDSLAAEPDQVVLTFTTAKGVDDGSVPRATLFPAGTDPEGATINYAADQALAVYGTSVTGLRTLRLTRAPVVAGSSEPAPARVLSGIVALADQPPAIATSFPPFGNAIPGTSGVLVTSLASLGFAVTSPTLMLTGGQREIHLGLTVSSDSLSDLTPVLQTIGAAAGGIAPMPLLAQVLQAAFALRYSTAGGWVAIESYTITAPPEGQAATFDLMVTLPAAADAFVALSTLPAAKDAIPAAPGSPVPDRDQPTLLAALRQEPVTVGQGGVTIAIYPYAVLSRVALSDLSIRVAVDDLGNLSLATPNGPVDASQPFAVFGGAPVQYAALSVTSAELFAKQVTNLSVSIAWAGLPVTSTGFKGYYASYVVDADGIRQPPGTLFDNASFQVRLDVVHPGLWTLAADPTAAPLYLFRTDAGNPVPAPDAPVLRDTILTVPALATQVPPAFPSYYDPSLSAVRLSLVNPAYAFGDTLYSANVMAASVRLTAAASACSEACARQQAAAAEVAGAARLLDPVHTANAATPASAREASVGGAVEQALSGLAGMALKALQDGLAASGAVADTVAQWRASLTAALAKPPTPTALWQRLTRGRTGSTASTTVLVNLRNWIAEHAGLLGPAAQPHVARANTVVSAATRLAAGHADSTGQSPAVARPTLGAATHAAQSTLSEANTQGMQQCIQDCMGAQGAGAQAGTNFPNLPWLPTAASVTVGYEAATALPGTNQADVFFHLLPFDAVAPVAWPAGTTVPLLAQQDVDGALYVGLSAPAQALTLLFAMAPDAGGWPADSPPVTWSQAVAGGWTSVTPMRDGTNGLQNTGIVSLTVALRSDSEAPWLRLSVTQDPERFPLLAALTPNVLTASWVGPGGAASLGTPLPAGTISASNPVLVDIGTIDQPLPSFGGRPSAVGPAFQLWMAERLRHKGFGIQAWDYARLVLAEFPSLWQVAIVPASDAAGNPAPGNVWVVVVAGPTTTNIPDPTEPFVAPALLADVRSMLAARISPFITLAVTDPPYQRMKVTARLVFSDADTVAAWVRILNSELIAWLSPWPDPALGLRPANYYTEHAVAEFVRHRPYVLGVLSLRLDADPPDAVGGWRYLTSALAHDLSEGPAPAPKRSRRALPGPADLGDIA